MARKLNPDEERLLNHVLLAQDLPPSLENELLFENIASKRDQELQLSPELLAFFDSEFSHPFFSR